MPRGNPHSFVPGLGLGIGPGIGLRIGLGLGVSAAALAGCAANGGDEGLLVLKNVVPTATAGGCAFSSQETEVSLVRGALDVTFGTGYEFIAQVKSRITALAGQESQRTVFTRGANVDVTFADANLLTAAEVSALNAKNALHFMSPFTAPIAPNGGVTDVLFELIPPEVSITLATKPSFLTTTVQASFTIVGDLAGGDVSSQKFQYTVTLTNGGFKNDKGPCTGVSASFSPRVGNPCNPGQDGLVDCCQDVDRMNNLVDVCPAVGRGP
jgi:hypothetical protein